MIANIFSEMSKTTKKNLRLTATALKYSSFQDPITKRNAAVEWTQKWVENQRWIVDRITDLMVDQLKDF